MMTPRRKVSPPMVVLLAVAVFWLANRMGYVYDVTGGSTDDRITAALDIVAVLSPPYGLYLTRTALLWGFGGLGLAALVATWIVANQHKLMPGAEHGSARWGTAEDIKPFIDPKPENNIILTETERLSMAGRMKVTADNDYNRNKNVLIIGGSGSRKTRGVIKPNLLQLSCNYVITDPKGELLEDCGGALLKSGYTVKIFNLKDRDKSDHYNLFAYLHSEDDLLKIAKNLITNMKDDPNVKPNSDPIWEEGMTALIEAIFGYVLFELPENERNMNSAMRLFRLLQVKEDVPGYVSPLDLVFQELGQEKPDAFALKQWEIYKMAAPKTAQSINVSLGLRLSAFNIPSIQNIVADDDLDLLDFAEDKKVALFVVLPDTDPSFNFLAAVMYQQLFDMLALAADHSPGRRLPRHCRFLLDEFANIGQIPHFQILISTIRSREISVTIVYQTLAQLKSQYKDDWPTIMGNCDSWLLLGGDNNPDNLEFICKLLGKATIETLNPSETSGSHGSYTRAYQTLARDLLTPDEIRTDKRGWCLLVISGLPPFHSRKYDLTTHPNYKLCADADPDNRFTYEKRKEMEMAGFFQGVKSVTTVKLSELNSL